MRKTNTPKKNLKAELAMHSSDESSVVAKSWNGMIVPATLSVTVSGSDFLLADETTFPVIFCSQDQKDVVKTVKF